MKLYLYNTLTRKKEEFVPLKEGYVGFYSCGPTVYNYAHIGNLRYFVFSDILKRVFLFNNYKVKHVMNITDVDDKTIKHSRQQNKSLKEFTEFYTAEFFKDLNSLNIIKADITPKASETIPEMVELVKKLKEKDFTYDSEGDIYYRISNFKDYGKLANLNPEQLKKNASGRLDNSDEYKKENARDFALWKSYREEDGDVFWETDIGKGRPGWHLECSAMSRKFLGQPFDIHSGGEDLIFPHHTNEIAQSEAAYDKKFCNYFVHCAFLIVNGEKMSKSLGNFYTLRDLLKKEFDPVAIRYVLMSVHYKQKLNLTDKNIKNAQNLLKKLKTKILEFKKDSFSNPTENTYLHDFHSAINDDLNMSAALAVLWNVVKDSVLGNKEKLDLIYKMDEIFGLDLDKVKEEELSSLFPDEFFKKVNNLIQKRLCFKLKKQYSEADKIKEEIFYLFSNLLDNKKYHIDIIDIKKSNSFFTEIRIMLSNQIYSFVNKISL